MKVRAADGYKLLSGMVSQVCIHPSLANNSTVQGYARELSAYLNGASVSGRLGKNGGFERNTNATQSGILKIHIKIPGSGYWPTNLSQVKRTSNDYLVYVRHWDYNEKYQILAIITPDAHERIDGLLPDLIKIAEKCFHDLNDNQLKQLTYY
ncbi:hypothetical protein G5574_05165 [Pantoea stewartii]|uniref:type II toxin-antitoxin system YafO family toxin n=1 Tax=Pantoea stewartii TaxID=66269 RepID=UPI0013DE1DD6|nr:type II toxin-antitoxin system YafO family toxin [Pantoea stewartii]QIE96388.1 hypothetical protein G5574_05165 [Pantoea stewartii]